MLREMGILTKLMALVALSAGGFVVVTLLALSFLKQSMLDDRMAKVRNLTEIGRDVVQAFYDRSSKGEFDETTAQNLAKQALRNVRYDKVEYFFIYKSSGENVLLPPRPEREGQNMIGTKDANGIPFVEQLIAKAQSGGGTVFYQFPRSGSDTPIDKVSYATGFSPWGWIIGTGIYIDDVESEYKAAALRFGGTVLLITLLVVSSALWLARHIATPLKKLATITDRLAKHEWETPVTETGRADEVGQLARSIDTLRVEAAEANRLRKANDDAKIEREEEKRRQTLALAMQFESSVKQVADIIDAEAAKLQNAAQSMSNLAGNASSQATAVAAAAEQASANVATVAAAAEELSGSIQEISRQVQQSSGISSEAVTEAEKADQLVVGLAEAAQKIGDVVSLINDIASQTNLLALNATIEAARAGDAGKGFAVVAGEVKSLANQTARATDEISAQVSAVQTATQQAVNAIRAIGGTIGKIHEIAEAIAIAIEEQHSATAEISRNVQQAAQGTSEVTLHLSSLSQATTEVGSTSTDVLDASTSLSTQANRLQSEVGMFLAGVQA